MLLIWVLTKYHNITQLVKQFFHLPQNSFYIFYRHILCFFSSLGSLPVQLHHLSCFHIIAAWHMYHHLCANSPLLTLMYTLLVCDPTLTKNDQICVQSKKIIFLLVLHIAMISVPGADAVPVTMHSVGWASDTGKNAPLSFEVLSGLHTPVTPVQKDYIFSVKTVTRILFTVSLPPNTTVFNMKKQTTQQHSISACDQQLHYDGRCLQDSLTLQSYNIQKSDTVRLAIMLSGHRDNNTTSEIAPQCSSEACCSCKHPVRLPFSIFPVRRMYVEKRRHKKAGECPVFGIFFASCILFSWSSNLLNEKCTRNQKARQHYTRSESEKEAAKEKKPEKNEWLDSKLT